MKPNSRFITIRNNQQLIQEFLEDLIIKPRVDIQKWSKITKQTPTLKIGYVGQHLTSLILGMEGGRTGARGHDIIDETEVKSCTKIDQADKCKDCGGRVMRSETICPHCGSQNIDRKDDSKWLFSVRTAIELKQLLELDRIFLLISDYPNFNNHDFSSIRFEGFEIYPKNPRMKVFRTLLENYYHHNYLPKAQANKKTAPMNFHPYSFQFYMSNPIKVFSCNIDNIDTQNPMISISHYIAPDKDRSNLLSENMPIETLQTKELLSFLQKADFEEVIQPLLQDKNLDPKDLLKKIKKTKKDNWNTIIPLIDEKAKEHLDLRDIIVAPQNTNYQRN